MPLGAPYRAFCLAAGGWAVLLQRVCPRGASGADVFRPGVAVPVTEVLSARRIGVPSGRHATARGTERVGRSALLIVLPRGLS